MQRREYTRARAVSSVPLYLERKVADKRTLARLGACIRADIWNLVSQDNSNLKISRSPVCWALGLLGAGPCRTTPSPVALRQQRQQRQQRQPIALSMRQAISEDRQALPSVLRSTVHAAVECEHSIGVVWNGASVAM